MRSALNRQWMVISVALGVVAVLTVAAVLVVSARGGGSEARSAGLVPADAWLYAAVNTDLTSDEWLSAFRLSERLGVDDPEQELRATFDDEADDFSWEDDLTPLLGGDVGIYVRDFSLSGERIELAVILRPSDASAALESLRRNLPADLSSGEYEGVNYETDGDAYLARLDEFIVVATGEAALQAVVDVQRGAAPSLADDAAYQAARGNVPEGFITFTYLRTAGLLDRIRQDPMLGLLLSEIPDQNAADGSTVLLVNAGDDAFALHVNSSGESAPARPAVDALEPRESRLAERLPAATTLFGATFNVAQLWEEAQAADSGGLDQAAQLAGLPGIDGLFAQLGATTGIDAEALIGQLTGEVALGAWWTGADTSRPEFALLADVEDEAAARAIIEDVMGPAAGAFTREQAGDAELLLAPPDADGAVFGFGLAHGVFAFGTAGALHYAFDTNGDSNGDSLAEAARYRDAIAALHSDTATHLFVDVPQLATVFAEDVDDPMVAAALQAMRSLIFNLTGNAERSQFEGLLQIGND